MLVKMFEPMPTKPISNAYMIHFQIEFMKLFLRKEVQQNIKFKIKEAFLLVYLSGFKFVLQGISMIPAYFAMLMPMTTKYVIVITTVVLVHSLARLRSS